MKGKATPLATGSVPAWSHVVGIGASRVVVYEDLARGRRLTLRWWNPRTENWQRKALGRTLERDRRGEIVKASRQFAENAATVKSAALIKGTPDEIAQAPRRFTIGMTESVLVDPETGPYPHKTPFRSELIRALDLAAAVWGAETPWASVTDEDWTRLMRRRLEGLLKRDKQGIRMTEITVSRINTATEYLRDQKKIPRDAALLPKKWRKQLLDFWRGWMKKTTGVEQKDPVASRPRHTLEEMRKILKAADAVDPRFGLLMQLAAEYRAGQAVRGRRSDIDLTAGTFTIHGRGKKLGATIDLTPAQRAHVERVLTSGYLAALERQYLTTGTDYFLFPAGRIRGKGTPDAHLGAGIDIARHCERQWIIDNFRAAETLAEVVQVKGRAQYGLRRQNVDAMNDVGISALGKQASGGWSSTDVPDAIYAESTNKAGRAEAQRVRSKTRGETS